MAFRSSSGSTGTSATPSTAVPTGVQIGDIVVLVVSADGAAVDFTGKYPTGFTESSEVDVTRDGQSVAVAWKRLTAVDTGSYTCASTGSSNDWACAAFAFSGRNAINDPVVTAATNNGANTSPITVTATGLAALAGDDLLWISAPDVKNASIGTGHTPPSGYTGQQDIGAGWTYMSGATRDAVGAGATGSVSGTFTISSSDAGWAAFLVRLQPVTVVASDNFNRADESPLAAPWTVQGANNLVLQTNTVGKLAASDHYSYYAGAASSADQYSQASEVSAGIVAHDWGPAVRVKGAGAASNQAEGYAFDAYQWNGSNFAGLIKHVGNSFTQLTAGISAAYAFGDVLRIEAEGQALRGYRNGLLLTSHSDPSLTTGQPGLFVFDVNVGATAIDNWSGGDLGGLGGSFIASKPRIVGQTVQRSAVR